MFYLFFIIEKIGGDDIGDCNRALISNRFKYNTTIPILQTHFISKQRI